MYKCSFCSYNSPKEFNVQRHEKKKHLNDVLYYVCDHCGKQYMTEGRYNRHVATCPMAASKVEPLAQKVEPRTLYYENGDDEELVCSKCGKGPFARQSSYTRHMKSCTGKQPLQCPMCYRICASASARWHHVKHCKGFQIIPSNPPVEKAADAVATTNTLQNVQQNAQTINNAEQINNVTQNIYIFDPNCTIIDDTMDKQTMKHIFPKDQEQLHPQLCNYAAEIMKKECNQNVRKRHMTSAYSHVRTEKGWKSLPDNDIYGYMSRDIAISANDRLYEHPTVGNPKVRERLAEIVSEAETSCKDFKDLSKYLKALANQIDEELRILDSNSL